jgi:dihydroflavonol-4-reductase
MSMHVAITGGTGFVGSHAVAAILDEGHDVRLLVRSPEKVAPAMQLQGIDPDAVDVAVADLRDPDAIAEGLEGCDAVVHAASVFTFDPARWDEMRDVNLAGMQTVIDAGIAAGLDPIVHVSSYVALVRDGELRHGVGPDEPPGDAPYGYCATKAAQERAARRYQEDGHPVVIVHPGGVWGPRDPYLGESHQFAQDAVKGRYGFAPGGEVAICDVRDVARVLAACLQPGRGPRRYSAVGTFVPFTEIVTTTTAAAGKQRRSVAIPDAVGRAMQHSIAALNRRGVSAGMPAADAMWLSRHTPEPDNSRTESDLGVTMRPPAETIQDQVSWMQEVGRL